MAGRNKSITREHLDAGRIDLSDMVDGPMLPPVRPGEVLREEFLIPLGLSATRLAQEMGVPANRVTAKASPTPIDWLSKGSRSVASMRRNTEFSWR